MELAESVLRAVPDGLWVLDDHGLTVWANDRLAQLLGLAPEEVAGFPAVEALDGPGREQLGEHLERLRSTGEPGDDLECLLVRRDGTRLWAQVSHVPLVDGDGARRGWLHRVRDHTAQRRVLEELELRESQLAEAQSIARIGSWERRGPAGRVRWSAELYRVMEVDAASFVPSAESFVGLLHPDDRDAAAAAYAAMMSGGGAMEFDARLDRAPGLPTAWVRTQGRVLLDDSGELLRVSGTVQDVTDRKESEQGLAFLSAMAGAANEAHSLGEALIASDRVVRPFTQWPAVLVSAPDPDRPGELVHFEAGWGEVTPEQLDLARRLAERVQVERALVREVGPSGSFMVAGPAMVGDRLACVVVSDTRSAGEPRAYELAIFTRMLDLLSRVSEREETQKELASARDAALAASRAKSEFLATMSHEIRTPLNGVIGLSELLSRTELTPHQRRLAEGVDQAGRALLALVTDILDLSKVEAGRLDLELVDFDPRAIVEQSVGLLAGRAAAKHLELVVSSADQMPATVAGDPVRFGQVITNLVANAVKFTGAGEVWVRASGEGGTAVRVEVRDTGIGVAPEVRHRLFTAFSQADSSTTREYGGTGLGLAISERIVDAMGGEIGVDSEPGAGSTFWFTVPFAAPAAAPAGSLPQGAVTGLHVLVVDDNATNRFILAEQLEAWQAKVTVVASAEDALAGLDAAARANEPFDVALLDYLMPGTDGEELARAIRDDERYAAMRIALLSSSVEPTAEWLAAAGIDAFIGKPVLASRLFDSLADLTGRGLVAGLPAPLPSDAGEHPVRGRLLVVEDNPVNQLVAHGILTGLGYDVVISENGSEAVGAVADDPAGFDAVLMDCQMPVMDGFDATRALRAMEGRDRHVPIIAMTASATAEERERCREAGMDDFLSKPVAPDVLATTLARWLPAGVPPGTAYEPTREERDTPCRARVRALVEDDGLAPGLVRSIADRFATSSEATYDELVAGARAGDHAGTAERSHRIRGSALNLGLTDLAGHCLEVETATRAGRLPDDSGLVALGAALAAAVAELDDACARLPR